MSWILYILNGIRCAMHENEHLRRLWKGFKILSLIAIFFAVIVGLAALWHLNVGPVIVLLIVALVIMYIIGVIAEAVDEGL